MLEISYKLLRGILQGLHLFFILYRSYFSEKRQKGAVAKSVGAH